MSDTQLWATRASATEQSQAWVLHFFFLEQCRRTARHFIKVEKNVTRVKETQLTHTTPWKLSYRLATKTAETTKCLRALSSSRQRPENKFLEFGGSSRAPEPPLRANSPDDLLNVRPLVVEDTSFAMLPYLPCHQDYQGVEAFMHSAINLSRTLYFVHYQRKFRPPC
jgi:hypothetical protein